MQQIQQPILIDLYHSEKSTYEKPQCIICHFNAEKILQTSGGMTQVDNDYEENTW
ncbi:MAG: hypothetical protein Q4C95_12555 [Planctomycetia bacterium]|nr:hypothetical protein [Planctomycetia bacterium]